MLAVQATYLQAAFPDKFEKYKNLKCIKEKIDCLPEIQKYKEIAPKRLFPMHSNRNAWWFNKNK